MGLEEIKAKKNAYMKIWNQQHKNVIRERKAKYYLKNKEHICEKSKQHYQNNKEHKIVYAAQWKKDNPEKVICYRKKEQESGIKSINSIRYKARKKKADGSFTVGEWENLKMMYGNKCPSCGKKEPKIKLTADHIIPLSKGGSNYIENIQPLCQVCNSKKYTKIKIVKAQLRLL